MSAWESFGGDGFGAAVERMAAAMESGRERDLAERRQMGLAAYVRAHEARDGAGVRRGQIVNSFAACLGLQPDDL